jgi:hypothetical protein
MKLNSKSKSIKRRNVKRLSRHTIKIRSQRGGIATIPPIGVQNMNNAMKLNEVNANKEMVLNWFNKNNKKLFKSSEDKLFKQIDESLEKNDMDALITEITTYISRQSTEGNTFKDKFTKVTKKGRLSLVTDVLLDNIKRYIDTTYPGDAQIEKRTKIYNLFASGILPLRFNMNINYFIVKNVDNIKDDPPKYITIMEKMFPKNNIMIKISPS